jgi:hypothetical protein
MSVEWIDANERLPESLIYVMVAYERGGWNRHCLGFCFVMDGEWCNPKFKVTHWAEAPLLPDGSHGLPL